MTQAYSNPERESEPHALPDIEVFELTALEVRARGSNHEQHETGKAAYLAMLESASDAPRDNLRDRVPYGPKKLASMCRKFLSLSFGPGNPLPVDQRPTNRDPIYPRWTCRVAEPCKFLSDDWRKHDRQA